MRSRPLVMHICGGGEAIGGVRQHLWSLAPHLQQLGLEVEVVFLGGGAAVKETRERGIPSSGVSKRGRGDLWTIPRLAAIMRRRRPEIVHTHTLSTNFYGRFAALLAGVPRRVTSVHSFMGDLLRHDPAGRFGNRLLYRQNQYMNRFAHRLVAVSEGVRDWLLTSGVEEDRVRLVRCGIDLDEGHGERCGAQQARERLGLGANDWVIGNVARAHPVKDQMTLLNAVAPMALADPSLKLAIIGDGPELPRLRSRARSLGVEDQVRLPGRVSNARALLPAFDVFVLSSKMEGIPLSVLEAMSARLPVVATQVGGVPEVIEDGVSGILVPEGSPERLREGIGRIQTDRDLAREIAGGGRLRVERDYDAKKTSYEMGGLYDELLRRTPAGRPVDRAE